jgi:hypothetical protein
MTAPPDDELSAMLEARADRMQAAAGREVLAAVREEMRAPRGGARFALLPVVNGRGMNGPVGWAAIGLVAVLVLAVMGGRLGTGPTRPSSGAASVSPPAVAASPDAAGSTVPAASTAPATQVAASPPIPTVTMDQLRTGLADGTLEGWTVLVTGRLELQPWPCPSPMPEDCYGLQLHGLNGVDVAHAGVMTATEAFARIPGDMTDRPMAFRVTGGQLALLGWVTQGADAPLTVSRLLQGGPPPGRAEVAAVDGWLIGGRPSLASCPGSAATQCSVTRPVLADASPRPDGQPTSGDAIEVTVDGSLGLAPVPAAIAGPFLVRYSAYRGGDLPPWAVAARLDPATTVRVVPAIASVTAPADLSSRSRAVAPGEPGRLRR